MPRRPRDSCSLLRTISRCESNSRAPASPAYAGIRSKPRPGGSLTSSVLMQAARAVARARRSRPVRCRPIRRPRPIRRRPSRRHRPRPARCPASRRACRSVGAGPRGCPSPRVVARRLGRVGSVRTQPVTWARASYRGPTAEVYRRLRQERRRLRHRPRAASGPPSSCDPWPAWASP
jgi:hypothetical protein